jgi:uncharacterized integral membrane protein
VKILGRTALAIAAAFVVIFAAANREPVNLNLWPLPFVAEPPLYILLMAALAAGMIVGGIAAWMTGSRWRRRARKAEHEAKVLRADRDALVAAQHREAAPPPSGGGGQGLVTAGRRRAGLDDE